MDVRSAIDIHRDQSTLKNDTSETHVQIAP